MKGYFLLIILVGWTVNSFAQKAIQQEANCAGELYLKAQKLAQKGIQSFQKGKTKEGLDLLHQAKTYYLDLGCESKIGSTELNILNIAQKEVSPDKFRQLYQEIDQRVAIPENDIQKTNKGRLYYIYSRFLFDIKSLDSAIIVGNQALEMHKEGKDWKYLVKTNKHLGLVALYQQEFSAMEGFIDEAYAANKKHLDNNKKNIKGLMQLYGALYYKTGNYRKALEKTKRSLDEALLSMKTKADTNYVAELYNNIGLYYIELGDIYEAEDYCKNALQLSQKIEQYYEAAIIYLNMGELFAKQNNLDKAYFYYNQANKTLAKAEQISPYKKAQAALNINNNIANVAIELKRYLVALDALQKNLKIHQTEPLKKEQTYNVLGKYYTATKEYKKAKVYYQKALLITQEIYGKKHPLIAKIYFELSKVAQKEFDVEKTKKMLDIAQNTLLADSTDNKETPQISDKRTLLKILDAKARFAFEQGELQAAFLLTKDAVSVLGKLREEYQEAESKRSLIQDMIPTYELSIQLALELHKRENDKKYLAHIFELIETSKAMLLLDALKIEKAMSFGNIPQELFDKERRLKRELLTYEKQLFDAQALGKIEEVNFCQKEILKIKIAFEKLEEKLEDEYPKYHELKYNNKTASIAQVQSFLDKETGLVEYFVGNEHIYAFTIYKDTVWLSAMPSDLLFTNSIRALRSSLTQIIKASKDPSNSYLILANNARNIYQKYLAPALKENPTKRLLVIPDGLLNYVPFDVLLTEKPDYKNKKFKDLPYLIKSTIIGYHYSASLMLINHQEKVSNSRVRILGMASSYDDKYFALNKKVKGITKKHQELRSKLEKLPGAMSEVEELGNEFNGDFYINTTASEKLFKESLVKKHYSIIHLAMHGIVDPNDPEYSSLAFTFSQDSTEDDFLHAYELNSLNLHTDLVVLSACETGFGKYEKGEGVISLGRGFMYAGVPSLVMTLWSINDRATYILVKDFYHYLSEGYPKDEALRLAKLDYLAESNDLTAHPFFWASFINVGDSHPIKLSVRTKWWGYLLYGLLIFGILYGFKVLKRKRIMARD